MSKNYLFQPKLHKIDEKQSWLYLETSNLSEEAYNELRKLMLKATHIRIGTHSGCIGTSIMTEIVE